MKDQSAAATARAEINDIVARINDAWLHQRGDALTNALQGCFAEDVVMRGPGFVLFGSGRDFAVQSYHDFVAQAAVNQFSVDEPEIDVCGETAAAQYKWKMTYTLNGQEYTEHGHDVLVFSRRKAQWVVVWRVMLAEPN